MCCWLVVVGPPPLAVGVVLLFVVRAVAGVACMHDPDGKPGGLKEATPAWARGEKRRRDDCQRSLVTISVCPMATTCCKE